MADFIILAILVTMVFFILRGQFRRIRRGQGMGGCQGCSGCSGCGASCGRNIPAKKVK